MTDSHTVCFDWASYSPFSHSEWVLMIQLSSIPTPASFLCTKMETGSSPDSIFSSSLLNLAPLKMKRWPSCSSALTAERERERRHSWPSDVSSSSPCVCRANLLPSCLWSLITVLQCERERESPGIHRHCRHWFHHWPQIQHIIIKPVSWMLHAKHTLGGSVFIKHLRITPRNNTES